MADLIIALFFGLAYGVVLQRSGFCFARAAFELFLLRSRDAFSGIIAGMVVATLGFALITGIRGQLGLPVTLHLLILPFGIGTVLGGVLFGIGMTLAGMCAAGTLQRLGEGYTVAWITAVGVVIAAAYDPFAAYIPQSWATQSSGFWLATSLGLIPSVALTLTALLFFWWGVAGRNVSRQIRTGLGIKPSIARLIRKPAIFGGIALGIINTAQMAFMSPWTVAYPLSIVANASKDRLSRQLVENALPWIILDIGIVIGVMIAARLSGDLRWRLPRRWRDVGTAFGGGMLMGWGIQLAHGCSIGGIFSTLPSLSLSGWIFLPALCIGAWIGTRIVRILM